METEDINILKEISIIFVIFLPYPRNNTTEVTLKISPLFCANCINRYLPLFSSLISKYIVLSFNYEKKYKENGVTGNKKVVKKTVTVYL